MEEIARERLERVARIYKSNKEASAAIGMAPASFSRACRRHGIETPYARSHKEDVRRGPRAHPGSFSDMA